MDKLLTVTIPTYNVEKYLANCLDSFIIEEIMDKLEVLIVNDGSKDSSPQIAKGYEDRYPDTFRLINKENGGHGSTINTGIEYATGKYFKVVDSDDWVDKNAMISLVRRLSSCDDDLIYSNFYWYDDKSGNLSVEFDKPFEDVVYDKTYSFDEIADQIYLKMHGFTVRTSVLKQIPKIDEHCFYVDMEYVAFPIPYIESISFIPDFVYMYRVGLPGQSVSAERMQKDSDNYDRVFSRVLSYYDEQKTSGLSKEKQTYLEHLLARLFASRIKIYLGSPYTKTTRASMVSFDKKIKDLYPEIYNSNINGAVSLLRKTSYRLYPIAHLAYKIKK